MKQRLQPIVLWLKKVFEEEKHARQKSTIAILDGVRALAILFVITFHINWINRSFFYIHWHVDPLGTSIALAGGTGVTLFFVLSGFLLFMPYARALLRAGSRWPLARVFYLRRALRIMPGYYLSLFILIALIGWAYLTPVHGMSLIQYVNFMLDPAQPRGAPALGNLFLYLTFLMDSSAQTARASLNGPYWTLAVEWQFYMLLPLLTGVILLLVRRVSLEKRLAAVAGCLGGVMLLGLGLRQAGLYFQAYPTASILVSRAWLNVVQFFTFGMYGKYTEDFAVGMLVCLLYIAAQERPEGGLARRLPRLSPWLLGAGLLILLFSALWHLQSDPNTPAWPWLHPLMPVYAWLSEWILAWGYGACILALLFGAPRLQHPLAWMPLRWLGTISYSLYIWHLPLLTLLTVLLGAWPGMNIFVRLGIYWLYAALVIVPFCFGYYVLVEKPGIRLSERWRQRVEKRYQERQRQTQASADGEVSEQPHLVESRKTACS